MSATTIDNYITYMEEAFILRKVKRYSVKGKMYINTPYKIYFEDVGLYVMLDSISGRLKRPI